MGGPSRGGEEVRPVQVGKALHSWLEAAIQVVGRLQGRAACLAPHAAHPSLEIDGRRTVPVRRVVFSLGQRPCDQFEAVEDRGWDEPRPAGIDVAIPKQHLLMRVEAMRHEQV